MKDGILAGTGNSRFLRSVEDFKDRYPNYESFANALVDGNLPIDLNGINPDGWEQTGTPLNKRTLLSEEVVELLGLSGEPTVSDALKKLAMPKGELRVELGSYVGNGKTDKVTINSTLRIACVVLSRGSTSDVSPDSATSAVTLVRDAPAFFVTTVSPTGAATRKRNSLTWGDSEVSWSPATSGANDMTMFNRSGETYRYVIIGGNYEAIEPDDPSKEVVDSTARAEIEELDIRVSAIETAKGGEDSEARAEIKEIKNHIVASHKTENLVGRAQTANGLNYSSGKLSKSSVAHGLAIPINPEERGQNFTIRVPNRGGRFRGAFTAAFPASGATASNGFSLDAVTTSAQTKQVPADAGYFLLVYNTSDSGVTDAAVLEGAVAFFGETYEDKDTYIADIFQKHGRKNDLHKTRFVLGRNPGIIPFEQMTGWAQEWNTAGFDRCYQLFHGLYTEYAGTVPGFEEIRADTEYLANNNHGDTVVPTEISSITNGAMWLYHIPPLPDGGTGGEDSRKTMRIMLTSGVHGGEKKSIIGTYLLMRKLLEGTDDISRVLRMCDIYIMPLLNPWGIENNNAKNWNNVNINRDYPVRNWKADPSDSANTEPLSQYETRCITYWFNKINPHLSVDHHTFSGNSVGETKALQWGTSAFEAVTSLIFENVADLTPVIRRTFPEKFNHHNFTYGYARMVSETSGTQSRWACEQGTVGCTIECPMHLRWDESGYIWGFDEAGESALVSSGYFFYANAVKRLAEFTCEALNDDIKVDVWG